MKLDSTLLNRTGQGDNGCFSSIIPTTIFRGMNLIWIVKEQTSTGLFSDIKVLREGEKEIRLTYILTRKFFTRKINILVEEGISQKKLKKALDSARENSPFSDGMVAKAEEELREALRKQGYFEPEIKTAVEKDFKTSSVDILFEVCSSKRYRIKEITFSGQIILPEADLRRTMETREGYVFVPAQLESDVQKLKRLYNAIDFNRPSPSLPGPGRLLYPQRKKGRFEEP